MKRGAWRSAFWASWQSPGVRFRSERRKRWTQSNDFLGDSQLSGSLAFELFNLASQFFCF